MAPEKPHSSRSSPDSFSRAAAARTWRAGGAPSDGSAINRSSMRSPPCARPGGSGPPCTTSPHPPTCSCDSASKSTPSVRCARCRAGWCSVSPLPARWCTILGCCCSTSRSPASIGRWPSRSAGCSRSRPRTAVQPCWSRTTSKRARSSRRTWRSCRPGASWSWRRAAAAPPRRSARRIARRSPARKEGRVVMRDVVRHAWRVARKDLLVEFRSRTAILSAVVFTVLVLLVFNFGRDPTAVAAVDLAPSILWVTFTFAAMLALNRAFQLELENQALDGLLLAPVSRGSIYLGKLIANLGFVGVVEAVGLPLFVLFFNVPVGPVLLPLIGVIALATIGFVAVGTRFSATAVRTRFAELPRPVLLLPFLLLPLSYAVQATARLLAGRPLSELSGWLKLLAAYDLVFVAVALLLFPHTVDE